MRADERPSVGMRVQVLDQLCLSVKGLRTARVCAKYCFAIGRNLRRVGVGNGSQRRLGISLNLMCILLAFVAG